MKLLSKISVVVMLSFFLFGCADTAYQSGRVDQMLKADRPISKQESKKTEKSEDKEARGDKVATKQELREVKELEDKRQQNQAVWNWINTIATIAGFFEYN